MKPEQYTPTRKWVSYLLFACLLVSILFSASGTFAQTPEPETPPPTNPEQLSIQAQEAGADWHIEMELEVPADQVDPSGGVERARAKVEEMLSSKGLNEKGAAFQVTRGKERGMKVSLHGKSSLAQMRGMLFAELAPELDFLGGPIVMEVNGPVTRGQELTLLLETRPATGFVWELDPSASRKVAQSAESRVKAKAEMPSAPASQTLQLRANEDGQASIRLVYHRPWESDQPATRRVSVSLAELPGTFDLSSPLEVQTAPAPELPGPMLGEPVVGLPASFDWRAQNKLPPVRDQGSCGSCWSFGTVGALESALMVQGGLAAQNLSEQYLISCNSEGWSCNGGWWAHDYHVNKPGTNQSSAGAVQESVKPYSASNGTCEANYSKAFRAASWGYVNGGYSTVPSVDQIKNAIYTYGPVSAAVCSGSAWGGYRGGVFSTEERSQCSGTGQVNHAILLVGWNDAEQTWILRNSWGSGWGESGYMRIKWGTSNVGLGASYVIYTPSNPPTATPIPPTATSIPTQAPTPTPLPPVYPVPVNDNISAAKVIEHAGGTLTYTDTGNTSSATNESSDPNFPTSPAKPFLNTVWYRITPVSKGTLAINTTNSKYDTVLGVWTGQPGALKLVKWNDNYSTSRLSSLSFTTGVGVTYYIEVAGKTPGGTLALNLKYTPATVANNSISYAITAPYAGATVQSNYSVVQDVSRASVVSSDPQFPDGRGRGYRTVWFKFTPKVNGTLLVSTNGSNYSNLLAVWTRSSSKYNLIGWSPAGGGTVPITAGKTYYIEVASVESSGPSALHFTLNFTPQ